MKHILKQRDWALRRQAQRTAEFEAFLDELATPARRLPFRDLEDADEEFGLDASDDGCDCPICAPFLYAWEPMRKDAPS